MQIAAELGDNDRLSGDEFGQTWIRLIDFEAKTLETFAGSRCKRPVCAKRDPVAIIVTGKIILERVPFRLRLVVPIDVPHPSQVICAFGPHKIDNVAIGRDVTRGSFARAAVPLAVPTEPISVRLGPPLDQNR